MEWQQLDDRVPGIALRYPHGWNARIYAGGTVVVGVRTPAGWPGGRLAPGAAGIWIGDYGHLKHAFPPRPRRLTLGRIGSYEVFGLGYQLRFDIAGHDIQAFAALGPQTPASTRAAVLRVLASITATRPPLQPYARTYLLGRSVEGRPIRAFRYGDPTSAHKTIVVGCIHGTECAGMAITLALINNPYGIRNDLWVIQDLNPDGLARNQRTNAHGVDLNRNFPAGWRPFQQRGDPQYSGPHPFSEPETRIARDLIRRLHPKITIWFHQPLQIVRAYGQSIPTAQRYARLVGLPFRKLPWLAGTAPNWQNHTFPDTSSFVVELPLGQLTPAQATRYAHAIIALQPAR